jgi:predicted site-specific integrase-resolvase
MTLMDDSIPEGLTLRAAARRLSRSVDTVKRWLESGKLSGKRSVDPNGKESYEVFLTADDVHRLSRPSGSPSTQVFARASSTEERLSDLLTLQARWLQSHFETHSELHDRQAGQLEQMLDVLEQTIRRIPEPG